MKVSTIALRPRALSRVRSRHEVINAEVPAALKHIEKRHDVRLHIGCGSRRE
jgi:hypothetical protein